MFEKIVRILSLVATLLTLIGRTTEAEAFENLARSLEINHDALTALVLSVTSTINAFTKPVISIKK